MAEISTGWRSLKRRTRTVLAAVFSPILSYKEAHDEKRQRRYERNIGGSKHFYRQNPPIIQVLSTQRSLLTIPSLEEAHTLPANPQLQCKLVSSLPFEIRQLIWYFYAGNMKLHLAVRENEEGARLFSALCVGKHFCPQAQIWGTWNGLVFSELGAREQRPKNTRLYIIPLLLTCRQMSVLLDDKRLSKFAYSRSRYSEVMNTFLLKNTFIMEEPEIIRFMPRFLLQQRIDTIQSLRFNWAIGSGPPQLPALDLRESVSTKLCKAWWNEWFEIWQQFGTMKSLRELRVLLLFQNDSWQTLEHSKLDTLVAPMREITTPRSFELQLSLQSSLLPNSCVRVWESVPAHVLWAPDELRLKRALTEFPAPGPL